MNVAEALNTLISAVNVAHNKGGVYSMEETHYIYLAISFLNNLSQQENQEMVKQAPAAPAEMHESQQNVAPESEY